VSTFPPLKDLVFRILVALAHGDLDGGSLARALAEQDGRRVLPGHLYRTLDRMLDDGLIRERPRPASPLPAHAMRGPSPTRFFGLAPLGCARARAETKRLEGLVTRSRAGRLLKDRR
jgi:hypothetical protein